MSKSKPSEEWTKYRQAVEQFNNGAYYSAQVLFDSLGRYKHSAEFAEKCRQALSELKEVHNRNLKEERERRSRQEETAKKEIIRSGVFKKAALIAGILAVAAILAVFGVRHSRTARLEAEAETLITEARFEEAETTVAQMPDGKKKNRAAGNLRRGRAEAYAQQGEYLKAAELLDCSVDITDWELALQYRNEDAYRKAAALYAEGKYEEAETAFLALGGYNDSKARAKECERGYKEPRYQAAFDLRDAGQYEEAIAAFTALNGYKDSKKQIYVCETAIKDNNYNAASALRDAGKYEEAIAAFTALNGYKDSKKQITVCETAIKENNYNAAAALRDAGKYEEAIAAFTAANGYKDSKEQITETKYQQAKALLEAKDYTGAATIFIGLTGYKDVDNLIATDEHLSAAYRAEFKVGITVTFGSYAGENIEWLVLEAKGDERVLISVKGLEAKPYNEKYTDVTWETCTLRKWLNGEFYNTAFSAEEQAQIVTTKVTADKNPKYSTDPGKDTEDKVWLLSITEANKYFANDVARMCAPTTHAVENGASQSSYYPVNGTGACWWWLRSPGYCSYYAANVYTDGDVYAGGYYVDSDRECVRPVVVLRLS